MPTRLCCHRGLGITMVLSLSFILLLRYIACVILWFMICGVISAAGYGIWHCFKEYSVLKTKPEGNVTISDIGFQADLSIYLEHSQTWLIFSTAICYILCTLFYPIITFFLLAICIAYSTVTAVYPSN
ncbi:hypothetical protein GOODEAATRI_028531 [Goodea atripinnis]|uniref:Uncharacterized protein n=1 Tax=Goodea atripinnis TaxID=208336 RepID=A0ABV0PSI0_9TELE